jgi:16S rRNA (cytosine1402-N4)-methyltransferase
MDKSKPLSAEEVINTFSLEELSTIFFSYGEEKNSRKISKTIVEHRLNKKIKTTKDLVELIAKITPPNYLNKTLARIFQAVRIYVNDELEMLKSFLSKSVELLLPGARLAVISYHSLEDRIVKDFFKYENLSCVCPKDFPVCQCEKQSRLKIITKKPIVPQQQEIILNNRSRSAKLRIAEKI